MKKNRFHEEISRKLNFLFTLQNHITQNSNGLIGRYLPKGTDFRDITHEQVMRVQNILNSRPRNRLGYMTTKEKYKILTYFEFDSVVLSV